MKKESIEEFIDSKAPSIDNLKGLGPIPDRTERMRKLSYIFNTYNPAGLVNISTPRRGIIWDVLETFGGMTIQSPKPPHVLLDDEITFLTNELGVPGHGFGYGRFGKNKTDARWLEAVPLQSEQGEKVSWDLAQLMHQGQLEFPVGKTGEPYEKFDAIVVRNFLRYCPEWLQLKKKYAPRFEVKPYSFRDSWITRATALGIPDPLICRACGHGLVTHSRNYQLASDRTTRQGFKKIQ